LGCGQLSVGGGEGALVLPPTALSLSLALTCAEGGEVSPLPVFPTGDFGYRGEGAR
jgi:hypothetical protein